MLKKELNKKQIIIVSLISLLLVTMAVGLDMLLKASPGSFSVNPESPSAASPSEAPDYRYSGISSKLTEIVEEEPYEPSPEVLNLAYYYPDGADTTDVIHSYAGRLYTELTTMEAQYMAELYDLSDRTPLSMAKELGLPASRLLGKYNPNDASQDPNNQASWIVGSFKNANVSFYDGDGNRINAYSVVKEIMSMASVYSYYHNMYDYESMRDYAIALWKASHSYSVNMGSVYYDAGCLNRTITEEAEEAVALEKQQQLLEESLAKRTAQSSGEGTAVSPVTSTIGPGSGLTDAAPQNEATLFFNPAAEGEAKETEAGESKTAALTETIGAGSEETGEEASLPGAGAAAETRAPETKAPETSEQTSAAEPKAPGTQAASAAGTSTETRPAASTQTEAPVQEAPENEATFAAFFSGEGARGLSYQGIQLAEAEEATMFGGASSETEAAAKTPETTAAASSAASSAAMQETTINGSGPDSDRPAPEENAGGNESTLPAMENSTGGRTIQTATCPGHIDLYVTVSLRGIDDVNGLVRADTVGSDQKNFNAEWTGWTDEMLACARRLNAEDWFKRYGLTISAINVTNPLSQSEIEAYLERLPEDLSQGRRDVVEFALHSVGKVPYYWGGKPYGPSYEKNSFGTLVSPDTKGRVLRGLDCSGWINWVYWSVFGNRLPAESTGTLIGCGERISRAELRPGDIIVRTGADAHVVMFLEWAGNGNMIAVHETGGVVNNVTVSELSANWPYYRKLIE